MDSSGPARQRHHGISRYGRRRVGRVGNGAGFDLYKVRTSDAPWRTTAKLTPLAQTYKLATTQGYQTIETSFETSPGVMGTRPVIREGSLEEYKRTPISRRRWKKLPSATSPSTPTSTTPIRTTTSSGTPGA